MVKNIGDVRDGGRKETNAVGDSLTFLVLPNIKLVEDVLAEYVLDRAGGEVPVKLFSPRGYCFLDEGCVLEFIKGYLFETEVLSLFDNSTVF